MSTKQRSKAKLSKPEESKTPRVTSRFYSFDDTGTLLGCTSDKGN